MPDDGHVSPLPNLDVSSHRSPSDWTYQKNLQASRLCGYSMRKMLKHSLSHLDWIEASLNEWPYHTGLPARYAGLPEVLTSNLKEVLPHYTEEIAFSKKAEAEITMTLELLSHSPEADSVIEQFEEIRTLTNTLQQQVARIPVRQALIAEEPFEYIGDRDADLENPEHPVNIMDIANKTSALADERLYVFFRERHGLPLYCNVENHPETEYLGLDEPWSERRPKIMKFLNAKYRSINPNNPWSERSLRIMALLNAEQSVKSKLNPTTRILKILTDIGDEDSGDEDSGDEDSGDEMGFLVYNLSEQEIDENAPVMPCREDRIAFALPQGHQQIAQLDSLTRFYTAELTAVHEPPTDSKILEWRQKAIDEAIGDFVGEIDTEKECQICISTFGPGECEQPCIIVHDKCRCVQNSPLYGRDCIVSWLREKDTCPTCRQEIVIIHKQFPRAWHYWHRYMEGTCPLTFTTDVLRPRAHQFRQGVWSPPTFEEDSEASTDNFESVPLEFKLQFPSELVMAPISDTERHELDVDTHSRIGYLAMLAEGVVARYYPDCPGYVPLSSWNMAQDCPGYVALSTWNVVAESVNDEEALPITPRPIAEILQEIQGRHVNPYSAPYRENGRANAEDEVVEDDPGNIADNDRERDGDLTTASALKQSKRKHQGDSDYFDTEERASKRLCAGSEGERSEADMKDWDSEEWLTKEIMEWKELGKKCRCDRCWPEGLYPEYLMRKRDHPGTIPVNSYYNRLAVI